MSDVKARKVVTAKTSSPLIRSKASGNPALKARVDLSQLSSPKAPLSRPPTSTPPQQTQGHPRNPDSLRVATNHARPNSPQLLPPASISPSIRRPPSRTSIKRPASPALTARITSPNIASANPLPSPTPSSLTQRSGKSVSSTSTIPSPPFFSSTIEPQPPPAHRRSHSASTLSSTHSTSTQPASSTKLPVVDGSPRPIPQEDLIDQDWYLQAREEERAREREREAREHRKVLDLEISNASLLTVNAMLERTKQKQTSEIRALKRQLSEGAAHPLASPTFSSLGSGSPPLDGDDAEDEQDVNAILEADTNFKMLVSTLESLIAGGQSAIASAKAPAPSKDAHRVLAPRDSAVGLGMFDLSQSTISHDASLTSDDSFRSSSLYPANDLSLDASDLSFEGTSSTSSMSEPEAWANGLKPLHTPSPRGTGFRPTPPTDVDLTPRSFGRRGGAHMWSSPPAAPSPLISSTVL